MKILSGLFSGFFMGLMLSITMSVLAKSTPSVFLFFAGWGLGIWLAARAASMRQAWRRLFLAAAGISFISPALAFISLFTLIGGALSGAYVGSNAGKFFSGAFSLIIMTILGFVFGCLFLIAARLVRERKPLAAKPEAEQKPLPEASSRD